MVNTSLPPGFRFHPTDVELIVYYLKRKVLGKKLLFDAIAEVDVYSNAPWDLPDKSYLKTKDLKWYFFCARAKKYASGARMKRATESGYWKATGKDRPVIFNNKIVGQIKTLVFHQGKAPKGDRTNWVMHEYRLDDKDLLDKGVVQDSYSLSVVFQKDGIGPRNGAQYGAPFKEEDWSDIDEPHCGEAVSFAALPMLTVVPPQINKDPVTHMAGPSKSICHAAAPDSCMSDSQISSHDVLPPLPGVSMNNCAVQNGHDDVALLLAQFTEEGDPGVYVKDKAEKQGNVSQHSDFTSPSPDFDPDAFFQDLDLPVLPNLDAVDHGVSNSSGYERSYLLSDMLPYDDGTFMELLDVCRPLNSLPRFSASDQQTVGGCSYANPDNNNNNDAQPPTYPVNHSSAGQHTFGLNKSDRW